jgi:hypothetical protein
VHAVFSVKKKHSHGIGNVEGEPGTIAGEVIDFTIVPDAQLFHVLVKVRYKFHI